MQKYGRLVIKNSILDSLVCSGDSLILEAASPRTHKPKIVNESLLNALSHSKFVIKLASWAAGAMQAQLIAILGFKITLQIQSTGHILDLWGSKIIMHLCIWGVIPEY